MFQTGVRGAASMTSIQHNSNASLMKLSCGPESLVMKKRALSTFMDSANNYHLLGTCPTAFKVSRFALPTALAMSCIEAV